MKADKAPVPGPPYAELHALSNFSFQRGASAAEELIERAADLQYSAIAITDECSLAGIVRAHVAAKVGDMRLIVGAEFHLEDGPSFVLLAPDREAYAQISRLITRGRQTSPKGRYRLLRRDCDGLSRCLALWLPDREAQADDGRWLAEGTAAAWLAVHLHRGPDDREKLQRLQALATASGLSCVAAGGALFHAPERKPLHDVLTAVRLRKPVYDCGLALLPNAEPHLRNRETLAELYPQALLQETLTIAHRCTFSLDELRYEYPSELVPQGHTPASWLRELTLQGIGYRWPEGASTAVTQQIEKELQLIAELRYEPFFLTVHDIVREAVRRGILCQGRGSAANSAVCYALGITAVDPIRQHGLFARFLSRERAEPPDIDVDFEHQRREEIIQYVFAKYGRERAALAATVICYRSRSALRDVGRALGVEEEDIKRVTGALTWWDQPDQLAERLREQGFDPDTLRMQQWLALTQTLRGFPRHLSQHVGGFIISQRPLHELVPIENAAMPDRQVIQWDKDDLESLGLLKVDVLALGMLTAIRRCFELVKAFGGPALTLATLPAEDPKVYAMIQKAETIGVFQIESRAQQNMLPRLKPENFYDLVIEIAIVRPGPITGGMVHPYLRRRQGLEKADFPPRLASILGRTLGVPIFQEQVMEIAIQAASFSGGEADQMRRSMAAWKKNGDLEKFRDRLIGGMLANDYTAEFAEQIYQRILGFGSYGFPESHSASFALLAYASSWLKHHHPAAFTAALLNSQPMGFYPPSMLVREARRVGVEVRPVCVNRSLWECTLERRDDGAAAIRLGLLQIGGLAEAAAQTLVATREQQGLFRSADELARRSGLGRRELGLLAAAGALQSLTGHRHAARWDVAAQSPDTQLDLARPEEPRARLRAPSEAEDVLADYRSTGLSLRQHPVALVRQRLARSRVLTAASLRELADKAPARVAGLVMFRQRPGGANGVLFMTLEDETGTANLILRPAFVDRCRAAVLGSRFAVAAGELQKAEGIVHLMVGQLADVSHWLADLPGMSRDFH